MATYKENDWNLGILLLMPKVSIIITTYNRPKLLKRAIKSAFESGTDVEIIVVDDASTEETKKVCDDIENIKYIRVERNQNVAGARNLGILASSSPCISFLDDDDQRIPHSLDWQVSLLDKNPDCGLVYGQFLLADQDGNVLDEPPIPSKTYEGDVFELLLKENIIGCLTAVFRKECLFKVGLLDTNYSGIDDWDLWIRIAELYPFLALKKPVAIWRKAELNSGQGSSDSEKLFKLSSKACKEKWIHLPRVQTKIEEVKNTDLYQGRWWMESRIEDLEKYIEKLVKGQRWLEKQHINWKQTAQERESQITELKNYAENLDSQILELKTYIEELITGKNWLERQYNFYREEIEGK